MLSTGITSIGLWPPQSRSAALRRADLSGRAAPAEKETLRREKTDLLYANEYRAKEEHRQKKSQRRERDAR